MYLGHILGLVLVRPTQEGGEGLEGLLFALLHTQLPSDEAAEDAASVFISRDAQEIYPVCVLEALAAPGIIHALDYPVGLFQYLVQELPAFLAGPFAAISARGVPLQVVQIMAGDAVFCRQGFGEIRLTAAAAADYMDLQLHHPAFAHCRTLYHGRPALARLRARTRRR